MGLARWYKRLRHTRGYGVHSPFAFRMVCEVLNPPRRCAYYLEAKLPTAEMRRLYRILVVLRPSKVVIVATPERLARLQAVGRLVATSSSGVPLYIVDDAKLLTANIPAGSHAMFADAGHEALRLLVDSTPYGHLYRNPRAALFVALPHLPRQVIESNW